MKFSFRLLVFTFFLSLTTFGAAAKPGKLLILYTNDLHDHIRPGYEGVGGMPYVSGYIKQVKSQRQDVLVLDAGDVSEKGDMVADKTDSEIMYEAMGRIGYDATVPGNHDLDHTVARVREWAALAKGLSFLCRNCFDPDGKPSFPPSKIFDVQGAKIGVIGLTVINEKEPADFDLCVKQLGEEVDRLRPDVHLVVVLCHLGSKTCRDLSAKIPAIQLFVSGHTHELIKKPIVVSETGALIVQAGEYAENVGRLELAIDLAERKIVTVDGTVVEMKHDVISCDNEMLQWVKKRESELCPDAVKVVGRCDARVNATGAAVLSAAALRWHSKADIAFCHTARVIRGGLPKGEIDVNALFCMGGQRGARLIEATLTGEMINDYLKYLRERRNEQTEWAGFRGASHNGVWLEQTDLEPSQAYRVVMPELEWTSRFLKMAERNNDAHSIQSAVCQFTFTDALTAYAEYLGKEEVTLDAHVKKLLSDRQLTPVKAEVR